MSDDSVLSQDEIDTLLDGVSSGEVDTAPDAAPGEATRFDFAQEHNILVSKLPRLGTLNDRFIRVAEAQFIEDYKSDVEIRLAYLHTSRFGEVRSNLVAPVNMNLVTVYPDAVAGMVSLDPKLLYILVDHYFGGTGDLAGRQPSTEFTPIELKMGEQFLARLIQQWENAWAEVSELNFTTIGREDNPRMVQNIAPNEVVFQAAYQIGFNGNFGEFHFVLPYTVIESRRDVLGSEGPAEEIESSNEWRERLQEEVGTATVAISSAIDDIKMTLKQLVSLQPGDVVPIDMPEKISLSVEGIPVFEGHFGAFNGKHAIKIDGSWSHRKPRRTASRP